MPQLAEMDLGTGMSRPGRPCARQRRSIEMAEWVVAKVAMRRSSPSGPLTA